MSSSLQAFFKLTRTIFELDIDFNLGAPWTCLFGASGSGKSTILRALAGLERPQQGRIELGSQVLFDRASHVWVAPHRRPVRLSAQRSFLFPGTVRDNMLYGVARACREQAEALLELMELRPLADTRASCLSGGEQQRVALARVLAAALHGERPAKLLLLDEPFNGMDAARRDVLAIRLRDALAEAGLPVLSVTHDPAEVFLLGAEVLRLRDGRITAQGRPGIVLAPERERLLKTLGS